MAGPPSDNIRLSVKPMLTRADERKLGALAGADLRTVGPSVGVLAARELERPVRKRRLPAGGSRVKRQGVSIGFSLSPKQVRAKKRLARDEMRSLSGYVQAVIVESLR